MLNRDMNVNRLLKLLVAFLLLLAFLPTVAMPINKITGVYSDMRFAQDSGDILGIEIFVMFSRSGYWVVFQDAEGSPSEPIVVKAKISNDEISFSLPHRNGYSGNFKGHIKGRFLVGQFEMGQLSDSHSAKFKLKRKNSYWQ
jgi:hypothetical protein